MTTPVETELRQRVIDGIGALMARVLRRDVPTVSPDAKLMQEGYCMSSANMLELMLELEEALGIQVDVEELGDKDLETVGSLADYIVGHAVVDE